MRLAGRDLRRWALVVALAALVLVATARLAAPDRHPTALAGTLVLMRTGGFAGVDDRLVVFPDGRWIVVRVGTAPIQGRLPASQVRRLAAALARADLPHRHPRGNLEDACCDRYFYTLAHEGSDYATVDGQAPGPVQDVLDLLDPLLDAPRPVPSDGPASSG